MEMSENRSDTCKFLYPGKMMTHAMELQFYRILFLARSRIISIVMRREHKTMSLHERVVKQTS